MGLALFGVLAGSCSVAGDDAARSPNILLISIDTLRADHLGCYGYERETTPFLDSLAREGIVFDNAFSTSSWTLPAHVSLLTSRHPASHGVENSKQVLPPDVSTLAEVLKKRGYATTAFTTWLYVSDRYGLDRGFDTFEYLVPEETRLPTSEALPAVTAEVLVSRTERWLEERTDVAGVAHAATPDFLFLHVIDPHLEYTPPLEHAREFGAQVSSTHPGTYAALAQHVRSLEQEPVRISPRALAQAVTLYDGEIRYVDAQLARLFGRLRASGWLDDALVIVTSDHGEEFDEHAALESHGMTLYDEMLRVPLIVKLPGGDAAGTRRDELVQLTDVAPTILDVIGLDLPAAFEGRSLLHATSTDGFILASTKYEQTTPQWALRTRDHKLVYTKRTQATKARFELFDLAADPGEQVDTWNPQDPVARRLRSVLKAWMDRERDNVRNTTSAELSDEDRARLRAMGYGG